MFSVLGVSPVSRGHHTQGVGQVTPSLFRAPVFDFPCLPLWMPPPLPWPWLCISLFPFQLCCLFLTTVRMQVCFYSLNAVLSFSHVFLKQERASSVLNLSLHPQCSFAFLAYGSLASKESCPQL